VFEGNGIVKGFIGNYSEYREARDQKQREEEALQASQKSKATPQSNGNEPAKRKAKRTFKEQKEYEQLETEMSALEVEKAGILDLLAGDLTDYQKITVLSARLKEIENLLDEKLEKWMLLDEIGQE